MSEPLYKIVIDKLISRIVAGDLAPGTMLPSEPELGAKYGVSQGTARKALGDLERRGILQRRQGVGTFVTVRTPETARFKFFRLRDSHDHPVEPALAEVKVEKRAATSHENTTLFGGPEIVYEIARVRTIEGARVIYETSVLPVALFPGLPERMPLPNTLYALYQQAFGIVIVRAEERIAAALASGTIASALGLKTGYPLIRVERKAVDLVERVVELRESFYLTDGYSYSVALT